MGTRRAVFMGLVAAVVLAGPASAAGPGSTSLMSRPDGLGALPPAGDGSARSETRALSGDGRFVVFQSGADDLGVRDTYQHVWLRDTMTGITTQLDRGPGGAAGDSDGFGVSISRDGSAVCFTSFASNLVAGVGPTVLSGIRHGHVYVVRLATGAMVVADRATGAEGALGDRGASGCLLDADGSRVAFDSDAANLVASDTNSNADVFVRDLLTVATQRVSLTGAGAQAAGGGGVESISGDGSRIAFGTRAALVAADTNDSAFDVYVRDTTAGTTFLASVATGSVTGDGDAFGASFADNGNSLAFLSDSTNLAFGDSNSTTDAFVRLIGADETVLVSRASTPVGVIANGRSTDVAISGDGLGVAFSSEATNLGATPPSTGQSVLYVRALGGGAVTQAVSRASGAAGVLDDRSARSPSLGSAPTTVTWRSEPVFGTPALTSAFDGIYGRGDFEQVFRRELSGDQPTELVSRPSGGAARNSGVNDSELRAGSVSADGRFVVFTSRSDGLVAGGASRFAQAYVRDNLLHTTTLVSRGQGDGPVAQFGAFPGPVISADGSRVAFVSSSPNLVQGISGGNVYVRTLATGELRVASRGDGAEGGPLTGSQLSFSGPGPALSRDGNRVAFAARSKLTADDTDTADDVFVRDLAAGTTTLVSVESGTPTLSPMLAPSISGDGTRVAFTSTSQSLVTDGPTNGGDHIYVRDLTARTTAVADRRDGQAGFGLLSTEPQISGDGGRVAFRSLTALTDDPLPTGGAVYVRDLAGERTLLASRADGAQGAAAQVASQPHGALSADGRIVTFSGFGLPGAADAEHTQIFRRDLAANTTTLVSAPDGGSGALPNSSATFSALDADGNCVAFTATGTGLSTPDHATSDSTQVYLRTVAGECPKSAPPVVTEGPGALLVAADRAAPLLSKVSLSRARFAVGSAVTALSAKRRRVPTGTAIRFTVSEPATVRIVIARRLSGRRSGKRCVKPTARLRRRARCTRTVAAVTLIRRVGAGRRSVAFSGRWARKRSLRAGGHQATLQATDAAGNVSARRVVRFTVVRR